MSVVVMGLSHLTAPMDVLERAALDTERIEALAAGLLRGENLTEAVGVATCNRLEIYVEALTFHGAVEEIGEALAAATGMSRASLADHLFVHYEERAIAHVFTVACGLESMAIGEPQILGQLREALERAQRAGTAGPRLNALFQRALRVGKRAHAETALDRSAASLVGAALEIAGERLGGLSDARVLVVGAGSMSALVAATVARAEPADLTLINRTHAKAERLVEAHSRRSARALPWEDLAEASAAADLVLTCTGAVGHVLEADTVAGARGRRARDQVLVDLALPRDIDPAAEKIDGVHVVTLADLGERLAARPAAAAAVEEVRALVTSEVAAFLLAFKMEQVGPTVAALRSRATSVVEAEMARLDLRLPGLPEDVRAEVVHTVHRIVEKLLHTPTVRIKELAGRDDAGEVAHVLRELFDLDPREVVTVSAPPPDLGRPRP